MLNDNKLAALIKTDTHVSALLKDNVYYFIIGGAIAIRTDYILGYPMLLRKLSERGIILRNGSVKTPNEGLLKWFTKNANPLTVVTDSGFSLNIPKDGAHYFRDTCVGFWNATNGLTVAYDRMYTNIAKSKAAYIKQNESDVHRAYMTYYDDQDKPYYVVSPMRIDFVTELGARLPSAYLKLKGATSNASNAM